MNFKPILFSTPMVQAILEGKKTMTRRKVKSKHESGMFAICKNKAGEITSINSLDWDERNCEKDITCPYGKVGDVLWVRETWRWIDDLLGSGIYRFKASSSETNVKWKPSIFMPKESCRIFLKITDIKVEKLQSISSADAKAEGAKEWMKLDEMKNLSGLGNWKIPSPFSGHQFSFLSIWCNINGCESWLENPWVWVISFKQIEKPENF